MYAPRGRAFARVPLGEDGYDAIVCPVVLAEDFVLACASENIGLWFVQGEIFEFGGRPVVWEERGLWNQGLEVEGSDGPRRQIKWGKSCTGQRGAVFPVFRGDSVCLDRKMKRG